MKFKDLTFHKIYSYNPFGKRANALGMESEWVARNSWGYAVAFGDTKKECIEDARLYVRQQNLTQKA